MSQNKKKQITKPKQQNNPVRKKTATAAINKQQLLMLFCLLVVVFIAYLPALNKDFINYDDDVYITKNPYIAGFSFSNLPAIFGNIYLAQYSPVPTVIYGIIYMISGLKPLLYNLIAVLMHLVNIMLVFKLIRSLNNNFRVAFITAALFGFATIQVEAVAWNAGAFKTCTYSIFFISSLLFYIRYIKTNKIKFIFISLLLFVLSCLCKEQAVALSLAIIVIDTWFKRKLFSLKVLLEKLPFLAISIAFGIFTIYATQSNKDITFSTSFSILDRLIYACYALCIYLYKMFVPLKMSLFYSYPPLNKSYALYMVFPLMIIILAGLWIWAVKKKNTVVMFGGLFFIVSMLFSLAIQVVMIRDVMMAERYAYIGSIGIFFMVANGADHLIEKKRIKLPVMAAITASYLIVTAFTTYNRTKAWKNTNTVMSDAIEKTSFPVAYLNRGYEYRQKKEYEKAIADYSKAIAVKPNYAKAYHNRGVAYFFTNRDSLAILDFNKALLLDSNYAETWSNRGAALARTGHYEAALKDFNKSILLDPAIENPYSNRALTYEMLGRYEEAIADYNRYLKIKPGDASIYNSIGVDKQHLKKYKESVEDFNKAISIDPQGIYY